MCVGGVRCIDSLQYYYHYKDTINIWLLPRLTKDIINNYIIFNGPRYYLRGNHLAFSNLILAARDL